MCAHAHRVSIKLLMSSTQSKIDLEVAYRQYTPVLFRALGALARNGFAVPPSDALDLIHDFFVDGWPSVRTHYNEKRGPLPNYVYVSFVHYARPRIVKLNRLRSALIDPQTLEEFEAPPENVPMKLQLDQWTAAIRRLPERDREFLQQYLYGSQGSERKLAEVTGFSRYAVREQLVRVVGKVIAAFGRPPSGEHADWRVAEAIWLDDRTVGETAALLGLTAEAVRRARARSVEIIIEALRRFESKRGGGVMANAASGGKTPITVETLLYQALTNPGNQGLLAELRARSSEIVDYLDAHDFVLHETSAESVGELWIAEVYEAIASGATNAATLETEQFTRELFQASQEDLASVGVAFKETLLPDLPVTLVRFEDWFGKVPRITGEEHQNMLRRPDVMAAFPNSAELAVYGIAPSMFYFATEAVSGLLDRLIRAEMHGPKFMLKANTPLEVHTEEGAAQLRLEDEVEKVTECSPERATAMLAWLLRAAEYKPSLFSGFEAEFSNGRLSLRHSKERYGNLYKRWSMAFATS
jgi:DNA-directed RNA polymerase specialized sigma24 family protein